MATLAIKVKRTDLIKALEARQVAIPKEQEAYKKAEEQHKKDLMAWAKKSLKAGLVQVSENSYHGPQLEWSDKAKDLRPESPTQPSVRGYDVTMTLKEIEQGLKILNLSDEEYVPASVAKNLSSLI